MRNLKRVLSLALACVMVIGMMVMTTGAADIVDIDEVENVEAVAVMNALGVLEGDENGVFNPTGTLTRAQAAKIIAFVKLGSTNAKKLATTGVSFTDVAANHWAAPYIGYCASLNIIAGNGDGTFAPEGELTGLAFGKMLLVALGFDTARYTNNGDWATNIATDMIDADLDVDGVILTNPISRDNAAQMAFNALFYSEEVEEVKLYTIEVTTDNSGNMAAVDGTSYGSFTEAYLIAKETDGGTDVWTITESTNTVYTDSLANEVFGLSYGGATDNFMSPATAYTSTLKAYKDVNDILVVDAPDYVIEGKILSKVLYSKVGYKAAGYTWTNYVDGSLDTTTNDNVKPSSTAATAFADTADGTVMYIYVDHNNQRVTTNLINTYIGEVKKVTEAKDGVDRFVTLTNGLTFTTEDFAVKDTVLYTYSSKQVGTPAADAGIQEMAIAEVVSGKLEKVSSNGTLTVDGTDYVVAAKGASSLGTGNLGKTVSFYVDAQNNIMKDKGGAQASAQYIFVLANSEDKASESYQTGVTTSLEIYGVDTNGDVVTATVSEIGGSPVGTTAANALKNKLYSYTLDNNGNYKLTDITTNATVAADIAVKATTLTHNGSDTAILNSDTTFVFVEQAKKGNSDWTVTGVTVKVGNANVGTAIDVSEEPTFAAVKDGVAKYVFVTRAFADTSAATDNVAYIIHNSGNTTETVSTGSGTTTTYIYSNAWTADGKLTITNKTSVAATDIYKLNEDGTVGAAVSASTGVITAINGNVITIDGSTSLNVTDKTVEIFTKDDVELKVGQAVAYKAGTGANASDLAYIAVTADQATVVYTVTGATTTAYELIKGTGVVNTVKLTVDISGASVGEKITVASADASSGDLDGSNQTAALTQPDIDKGTITVTVTYTDPAADVDETVTIS